MHDARKNFVDIKHTLGRIGYMQFEQAHHPLVADIHDYDNNVG
jgi:hypothetical protein